MILIIWHWLAIVAINDTTTLPMELIQKLKASLTYFILDKWIGQSTSFGQAMVSELLAQQRSVEPPTNDWI